MWSAITEYQLKGLIYKCIFTTGSFISKYWPALSWHIQELHVTKIEMLRWKCGVTCGLTGGPRKRWLDVVMQDMKAIGLTTENVTDFAKWSRLRRKADVDNIRRRRKKSEIRSVPQFRCNCRQTPHFPR